MESGGKTSLLVCHYHISIFSHIYVLIMETALFIFFAISVFTMHRFYCNYYRGCMSWCKKKFTVIGPSIAIFSRMLRMVLLEMGLTVVQSKLVVLTSVVSNNTSNRSSP